MIPTEDTANRLVLGIIDKDGLSYDEAEKYLSGLGALVHGGEELRTSAALQAAFLTAVNCGKRCFLGGLSAELPPSVQLLVPWPAQTLNEAVDSLLHDVAPPETITERIGIGTRDEDSWNVFATGWKTAVAFGKEATGIPDLVGHDFALGGILGGALAVHHAFVHATSIAPTIDWQVDGISLWQPESRWVSAPDGPSLSCLPKAIWFLGLGHLGQAYAWTLGLLPYAAPSDCHVMLQDTDVVSLANFGTGLLTSKEEVSAQKTRMVENWLRPRHFPTSICDRMFDDRTQRSESEPAVAFCGFHDGKSRRLIGEAGFDLVVEAGLGSQIADFDQVLLHTFPNEHFTPKQVWSDEAIVSSRESRFEKLGGHAVCGALALAGKAVSTSFVGATASVFAWAEVLRQYHKGKSFNRQSLSMRSLSEVKLSPEKEDCPSSVIAIRGFAAAA